MRFSVIVAMSTLERNLEIPAGIFLKMNTNMGEVGLRLIGDLGKTWQLGQVKLVAGTWHVHIWHNMMSILGLGKTPSASSTDMDGGKTGQMITIRLD